MKISLNNMIYSLSITFAGCISKGDKLNTQTINFNDTIRETHISLFKDGDTLRQHLTFYFAPVDQSIDTSNFFYTACGRDCSDESLYKIYFPRIKVVEFCDSMINSLPLNPTNEWDEYFNIRSLYKAIMAQAAANKNDEVVIANELSILLERFSPFIVNASSGDKPNYVIIIIEDNQPGYKLKSYHIKTASGDTIILDATTLRPIEIKME